MDLSKLENIGLSSDQIKAVQNAIKDIVRSSYVPLSQYDSLHSEKSLLEAEIASRDDQLKSFKKINSQNEELTKKIDELQKTNKETSEKYKDQIHQIRVNHSIESYLKDHGARSVKSILPHLDLSQILLTETDELLGLDKQVHQLLQNEETSFLFHNESEKMNSSLESSNIQVTGGFKPIEPVSTVSKSSSNSSLEDILRETVFHK